MLDSYEPGAGVSRLLSVPNQLFVIAVLCYSVLNRPKADSDGGNNTKEKGPDGTARYISV